MKKLFNNPYLVISLYLLFSFLIDIMTNLTINLSFSIGMILRGILLLYVIIGLLIKYKEKTNYFILGILGIFSCIYLIYHQNINSIIYLFKYNFVIIILLFLYNLYKNEDKKINRNMLTLCLLFYSLSIIIGWLTKTSIDSYAVAKVGTVGWFNSANEISAIISVTLAYIFVNLENRINFIEIFTIIVALFAAILIGTRLPLIVFLICMLYIFIKKLIKDIKNKKINYTNIIIFVLFIICFIFKFKDTPLCKNMMIHIKYLNLNNPIDVITNFKLFDHLIFNRRLTFLIDINKVMVSAPILSKLFGLNVIKKTVEMDLFDIFYRYGVVGFMIFVLSFTYIIKRFINRKDIHYLPIFIIIITAFLSGHVLLSPNVALISMIIIANTIYKRESKKILISAYDLGYGGIETALLSFIKNLNKDNNEITLFLEKKKGVFLKEVPKGVIIKQQRVFESKFKLFNKFLNMLNKIKFLITNFKEYDFSCCYATYSLSSNFLARFASNNSSIYIHSDYTNLYKNNINDINSFFIPRKLDKFKYIIFVSNESKDNLVSIYPRFIDKSIVLNNFIDYEKIINLSKEKIKETKPRGKKLFLFVGRIDESSKNLTRMINSFKLALEQTKKIELWIIGDGEDFNYIKKIIKDNKLEDFIKMFGSKSNPYPYFKLCDYLLLTSNYEGFPTVYGEAITLNKPIISTIDVTDESISIPNNYGYICHKDEKDIANTIIKVVSNDNLKYKKTNIDEINRKKYEILKKII